MTADPKLNKAEYKAVLEELRKIDSYVDSTCVIFSADLDLGSELMGSSWDQEARLYPKDKLSCPETSTRASKWHRN